MINIGEIFSIKTSRGYAYIQFMGKIPPLGEMIRVLPGVFDTDNEEIKKISNLTTNFWIFFPLSAALRNRIVRRIGKTQIPQHAAQTPTFRTGVVDPSTGRVETWWLWDGTKEWKVGAITDEQRKLPIRGIWNDTLLIERIDAGWTPELDPR